MFLPRGYFIHLDHILLIARLPKTHQPVGILRIMGKHGE